MGQLGFFDADKRLAALSAKGDPLEAIDRSPRPGLIFCLLGLDREQIADQVHLGRGVRASES